ncbi:hypothetical protein FS837_010351 [Tulasnella sp. UAMH 9824]|nr:hypothetical protein FS837_010351 [Tulasnella sp. UAMH 9824]
MKSIKSWLNIYSCFSAPEVQPLDVLTAGPTIPQKSRPRSILKNSSRENFSGLWNEPAGATSLTRLEPYQRGGSAAPFLNLPVEIFRIIVHYALCDLELRPYYELLLSLRLVSKKWAGVIDDTSELWIKIPLDGPDESVKLALSNSKDLVLDLEGHNVTLSVARQVIAETHRWRSLKLGKPGGWGTYWCFLAQSAPLLEILNVTAPPGRYLWIPMLNGGTPNIRDIDICRCNLPAGPLSFPNLQKLRLEEVQIPQTDVLLDILLSSPQLTHLHIFRCRAPFSPSSARRRVKLPHLRTLTLGYLSADFANQLVGSMEVPLNSGCIFYVQLKDDIPLENQLALLSQHLGTMDVISQGEISALSLEGTDRRIYTRDGPETLDDVELRYSPGEGSTTSLTIRVSAPPRRRVDILKFFASRLRLSNQSMILELQLIDVFDGLHTYQVISLLDSLSQALPCVQNLTFIDSPRYIEEISEVLHHLFPQDSPTCRMFPCLTELIIQTIAHDEWVDAILGLGNASMESGGYDRLPLDTLRLRRGLISRTSIRLLRKVVPTLLLDCVEVM